MKPGRIRLSAFHPLPLYLYDANGVLLEASERRGVRAERIILEMQPAGDYCVRVAGYSGAWDADDSYLLRFKVVYRLRGRGPWS